MGSTSTDQNGSPFRRPRGLFIPDGIRQQRAPRPCGEIGIKRARIFKTLSEGEIET